MLRDNTIVVFRNNDSESEELANYYLSAHSLSSNHKVGIDCSSDEILGSYAQFRVEVEYPIQEFIAIADFNVYVIVLGLNVPGGFYSSTTYDPYDPYYYDPYDPYIGNDIIAATSRLARINYEFSLHTANFLYNRQIYSEYNSSDAEYALIVSRIDAPTLALAKNMVNNSNDLLKQYIIKGKFYLDPYSNKLGILANEYTQDLLDFETRTLTDIDLENFITTYIDPYIDVVIPKVENDSFVWSWYSDRSNSSFFGTSTANIRGFLYNADADAAYTVRDSEIGRWCPLAVEAGYVNCAGAMSDPGYDAFLRPMPFYRSILNRSTIGEAQLYATPFWDWTISFFGDPLSRFIFAGTEPDTDEVVENESWRQMKNDSSSIITYSKNRECALEAILNYIVGSANILFEVALLDNAYDLYNSSNEEARKKIYNDLANLTLAYPVATNPPSTDVNTYVQENGYKISENLNEFANSAQVTDSSLIYNSGYWEFDFRVQNDSEDVSDYHFIMHVIEDADYCDPYAIYGNTLFTLNSEEDQTNWYYEKFENEFFDLPSEGVPQGYIGRRIRYKAPVENYSTYAKRLIFRVWQKDIITTYDSRDYEGIVSSL